MLPVRPRYLFLGLCTVAAVIGLTVSSDPERAQQLSEMYGAAAFTGDARDTVILLMAIGLGGFIAYLTLTRR
jgi:hypothetical protein